jgi:hypothetical protein
LFVNQVQTLALLLRALSAGSAQAEICSQKDLYGQWVLFAAAVADRNAPHDCVFVFDAYGVLNTLTSYCFVGDLRNQPRSGGFRVLQYCRVKGTVRFVKYGDVSPEVPNREWPTRACTQLSKMADAARWIPARKFLAVLS